LAIFDQHLAILLSETVQDRDIYLLWKTDRNSYALYRMALFPASQRPWVTRKLTTPNHLIFDILYCLTYLRSG